MVSAGQSWWWQSKGLVTETAGSSLLDPLVGADSTNTRRHESFEISKHVPSGILLPVRSYFLILPSLQLETKYSNLWAYESHSHSDRLTNTCCFCACACANVSTSLLSLQLTCPSPSWLLCRCTFFRLIPYTFVHVGHPQLLEVFISFCHGNIIFKYQVNASQSFASNLSSQSRSTPTCLVVSWVFIKGGGAT